MALAVHSTPWANELLGRVWPADVAPLTDRRRHAVLAISRGESGHAGGWKPPGVGSWNFGGIQACAAKAGACACSVPSFAYGDHHADGSGYTGCFRIYPTAEAGMEALIRRLMKHPAIVAGADSGDAFAFAKGMQSTGYFELGVEKYAKAIANNAAGVAKNLAEPVQLTLSSTMPATPGGGGGALFLLGLVGVGLALAFTGPKRR